MTCACGANPSAEDKMVGSLDAWLDAEAQSRDEPGMWQGFLMGWNPTQWGKAGSPANTQCTQPEARGGGSSWAASRAPAKSQILRNRRHQNRQHWGSDKYKHW